MTYKTIKAAKAAGYKEAHLGDMYLVGDTISVKGHTLGRDLRFALSRTAWKAKGYTPISDDDYHNVVSRRIGGGATLMQYSVYRHDQIFEKKGN